MGLPEQPSDQQLADWNQKQEFVRDAMPSEWLGYAEDLADAAEALWTDRNQGMRLETTGQRERPTTSTKTSAHARSYILLAGLALENALKALLVAGDPALVNAGVLAASLKSHKLTELAAKIPGAGITGEETQILETCQEAIPYWGRYPIPLSYRGVSPAAAASAAFRDVFNQLHRRLCQAVHEQIRDGWDSGVGPKLLKTRSAKYGDQINLTEPLF